MREHVKAGEEFVVRTSTGRRARALPRRGPGLQGRADRGPRLQRRRLRLALHQRAVHRPLPRPARALDRPHQGVQAAVRRRRLLARRLRQHDAHAHLRTAFHSKDDLKAHLERLEQARQRDHRKLGRELGLFQLLRARPGSAFLQPAGTAVYNALVEPRARCRSSAVTRRSRPRCSTTASCGRSPATGTSTARTCSSRRPRTSRWPSSP